MSVALTMAAFRFTRSARHRLKDTALDVVLGAVLGKCFGAPLLGATLGTARGAIVTDHALRL